MLTAAIGADGLIGSAFSGSVAHASWPGRAMLLTTAAWGAAITGFGFSRALLPALACLAAAGAADITTVLFRGTIVQGSTPDRLRGQVTAADDAAGVAVPDLGNLEADLVASLASPPSAQSAAGSAALLGRY